MHKGWHYEQEGDMMRRKREKKVRGLGTWVQPSLACMWADRYTAWLQATGMLQHHSLGSSDYQMISAVALSQDQDTYSHYTIRASNEWPCSAIRLGQIRVRRLETYIHTYHSTVSRNKTQVGVPVLGRPLLDSIYDAITAMSDDSRINHVSILMMIDSHACQYPSYICTTIKVQIDFCLPWTPRYPTRNKFIN